MDEEDEIKERYTEEEEAEKKSQARRMGVISKTATTSSSKFSSQALSGSSFKSRKHLTPRPKIEQASPVMELSHPVNQAAKWKGQDEGPLEVETIDLGGTRGEALTSDNDEPSHPATVRAAAGSVELFSGTLSKKSISIKRSIKARLEHAKTPYHSRAARVLSPSQVSNFLKNLNKSSSRMRNEDLLLSCTSKLLKSDRSEKAVRVASKSAERDQPKKNNNAPIITTTPAAAARKKQLRTVVSRGAIGKPPPPLRAGSQSPHLSS